MFNSALDVVDETLAENAQFEWDLKPMFRLQMAYLLLWSAIERYAALRYHLGSDAWQKVKQITGEDAFSEGLLKYSQEPRIVHRADDPETGIRLDSQNPAKSINYYYEVRSNITHRGKGVVRDHRIIKDSLSELSKIFRDMLRAAFEESESISTALDEYVIRNT